MWKKLVSLNLALAMAFTLLIAPAAAASGAGYALFYRNGGDGDTETKSVTIGYAWLTSNGNLRLYQWAPNFTDTGKVVTSFNSKADGSGQTYALTSELRTYISMEQSAPTDFYAQWTEAPDHSILYIGSNVGPAKDGKDYILDSGLSGTVTLRGDDAFPTGSRIIGWSVVNDFQKFYPGEQVPIDGNLRLTPLLGANYITYHYLNKSWAAEEKLEFHYSDGLIYHANVVTSSTTINSPTQSKFLQGWNSQEDGSGQWYAGYVSDAPHDLYAQYQDYPAGEDFCVLFSKLGLETDRRMGMTHPLAGGVVTGLPTLSDREGYRFEGWYIGDTKVEDGDTVTPKALLQAKWTKVSSPSPSRTYTIIYETPSGKGVLTTGTDGKLAALPAAPTLDGYKFLGWYTDYSSGQKVDTDYVFTSDTTIYAYWEKETDTPPDESEKPGPDDPKTFTITLDAQGGTLPSGVDGSLTTNTEGKLTALPNPTRTGYEFEGWYTAADGGDRVTADTVFPGDGTIYAHWTQTGTPSTQTYKITFDANGGSGGTTLTTGTDGKLRSLPRNPSLSGYTFGGWYTAPTGGEGVTTDTVFTKDTTVYARWTPTGVSPDEAYTITFDANGGTGGAVLTTGSGGKLRSLPRSPTLSGYTFDGWYTERASGEKVTTATVFREDATVYARWVQHPGSSDSSDAAVLYPIYTSTATGGSFYVSHTSAAQGAWITVTVTPWSNYQLSQLSVINQETGRELYLNGNSSTSYSFAMPAGSVEVSATFVYTGSGTTSTPGGTTGTPGTSTLPSQTGAKPVRWYYSGGRIYHVTDGLVPTTNLLTRDMLISVLYNMDSRSSGDPEAWVTSNNILPDIFIGELWGSDRAITREQAAMILYGYSAYKGYNIYQGVSLGGYSDYRQIRPIASAAMSWAQATGLITGTSPTTLSPRELMSCEQAAIVLARFVSNVAR